MKHTAFGVLLAATLAGPAAWATTALPAGTIISGTASGAAAGLLGLDSGFAAVAGSNVTALAPDDLEYLTSDYAVAIDFFSNGAVQFYDNGGLGSIAGSYTLVFDFSGLTENIVGFSLTDLSGVTAGTVTPTVLGAHSVGIGISNVAFGAPFGSFTAQIETSPVPEPATLALWAAGLGVLWGAAGRKTRP